MFDVLFNKLSAVQKGFVALVIGFILVFGAFDKLGVIQQFLNFVLIAVGLYLVFYGAKAANVMGRLKSLKRK